MFRPLKWVGVLTVAGLLTPAVQADSMGCLVEPDRVADLGSQGVGVIDRLLVERGDAIVAGQVLARLSNRVERASVSVAEARSQADAEYRQAVAASDLARRKLERSRDLLKQEFISDQAVDQSEAEARVAEQRVAQARESQKVALKEYQLSAAQLGQRDVRSPFDGIVVERYRTEGERIEREPVLRVAKVDPLRVEAIVPAAQFGLIVAGQMATVKTDLPQFGALSARVTLVDKVIDPASNSFRVRLTVPNPDNRIPAGLRCRIDFGGQAAKVAPAPVTPATPGTLPSSARSQEGVGVSPAGAKKPELLKVKPATLPAAPLKAPGPSSSLPSQASVPAPVAVSTVPSVESVPTSLSVALNRSFDSPEVSRRLVWQADTSRQLGKQSLSAREAPLRMTAALSPVREASSTAPSGRVLLSMK